WVHPRGLHTHASLAHAGLGSGEIVLGDAQLAKGAGQLRGRKQLGMDDVRENFQAVDDPWPRPGKISGAVGGKDLIVADRRPRGRYAKPCVFRAIAAIRVRSDPTRRSPRSGPPSAAATARMSSRIPDNELACRLRSRGLQASAERACRTSSLDSAQTSQSACVMMRS